MKLYVSRGPMFGLAKTGLPLPVWFSEVTVCRALPD